MASRYKLHESLRLLKAAEEALEKLERTVHRADYDPMDWQYDTTAIPTALTALGRLRESFAGTALAVAEEAAFHEPGEAAPAS